MKINTVKFLFAIVIALLLGFVCEIFASTAGGRNWVSLVVASITIMSGLIPAMGITFSNEKRGVSIKVASWMLSVVLIIFNVIFSLFEYRIDIYIAFALLLSVVGCAVIYALFNAWPDDNRRYSPSSDK